VHVVDEPPPSVDLDNRDPRPVLRFEPGVAVDRDFSHIEAELVPRRGHDTAGRLTKMAARRRVERDFDSVYG